MHHMHDWYIHTSGKWSIVCLWSLLFCSVICFCIMPIADVCSAAWAACHTYQVNQANVFTSHQRVPELNPKSVYERKHIWKVHFCHTRKLSCGFYHSAQRFLTSGSWPKNGSQVCYERVVEGGWKKTKLNTNIDLMEISQTRYMHNYEQNNAKENTT